MFKGFPRQKSFPLFTKRRKSFYSASLAADIKSILTEVGSKRKREDMLQIMV